MTYKPKKFATDRLSARAVRLVWQLSNLNLSAIFLEYLYGFGIMKSRYEERVRQRKIHPITSEKHS